MSNSRLYSREEILLPLTLINGSDRDYITPQGDVYKLNLDGTYYKKKPSVNKCNGYLYIGIHRKCGGNRSRRLHHLVAETYIPNPENLPCVMHLDNNKENCSVDNLKWGTVSENTRQAFEDGLLVNDRGFEDSQSIQVDMYEVGSNALIKRYGSISEGARELGIEKSSILNSCNNQYLEVRKPYYFRYATEENIRRPKYIGAFEYLTGKLIATFYNVSNASKATGISPTTICYQIKKQQKPQRLPHATYPLFFQEIYPQ